jgi:hypothetical protein
VKKLGIKPGDRTLVVNSPVEYGALVESLPADLVFVPLQEGRLNFIHLFVRRADELRAQFPIYQDALASNGMLWVSWPKRASEIETDLNENLIRSIGLENGLVDVKVCAVDARWSGLKFVFRLKDR